MMTIQEVEDRLRVAMAAAKARGYDVVPGEWGVSPDNSAEFGERVWAAEDPVDGNDCLCPMACLILGEPADSFFQEPEAAVARVLGCTEQQVTSFVIGYDGAQMEVAAFEEDDFYRLGKRLRDAAGVGA